jgi:acetyl esterase
MRNGYLNGPEDYENPLVSPLKSDLHDLPPAFVLTCSMDPLMEEGIDYVHKLQASGVPCDHINAIGMDHGCFSLDRRQEPSVQKVQEDAFAALKKALFQ